MRERLYRSRDERVLFGVAGGIGDWLNIDPTLVRIVFALLVITGGFGLLLYIVLAFVIPEEPPLAAGTAAAAGDEAAPVSGGSWTDDRAAERAARRMARAGNDGRGVVVFGAVLILIGAWFLLRRFIPSIDGDLLFPVLLIGIGGVLLAGALRGNGDKRG